VVVLLLAKMRAWRADGSLVPDCRMLRAELVPELVRDRTPAAPVLVLVKDRRLPVVLALEVSWAFFWMKLPLGLDAA
jgi:hypothetical protein